MEDLREIEQAIDYISRYGPGFMDELRKGSFNVIAATDLKRQAERLIDGLGGVALELAKSEARQ